MSSEHHTDPSFKPWAKYKCVELLFAKARFNNLISLVFTPLFALLLFDRVPRNYLWWWFGAILLLTCLRLFIVYLYNRDKFSASAETWIIRYGIPSFLIGICWGLAALSYYIVDEMMLKAIVMMVVPAIISTAMLVLTPVMGVFYCFVGPLILGAFTAPILEGGEYSFYIGLSLGIYCLVIFTVSKSTNREIMNTLKHQYDRKVLALSLKDEVEQRKKVQSALEVHQAELESLVGERTKQLQESNRDLAKQILVRKEVEEELKHIAHHDTLTNLPNRLLLVATLEMLITKANRHDRKIAVLFMDLNGFKEINDTYGHDMGDRVLQTVARILLDTLREEDTIARIGGDEFVVVTEFRGTSEDVIVLAEKIVNVLGQKRFISDTTMALQCSIGISIYPHDGKSVDELLRNADTAMYLAKKDKNRSYALYVSEQMEKLAGS